MSKKDNADGRGAAEIDAGGPENSEIPGLNGPIAPGTKVSMEAVPDPMWRAEINRTTGATVLCLLHPHRGWTAFLLPETSANPLAEVLSHQTEARRHVLDRLDSEPPKCTACGACCTGAGDFLGAKVGTAMPHVMDDPTSPLSKARRMELIDDGTRAGRCSALDGTIGSSCSCSIHDVRPEVCRKFDPDSTACLIARGRMGLA